MEPARSTDRFSRKITTADSNNIVTILDLNVINSEYQLFEQDYKVTFQTALEDVKCTVGLFSLAPAPFPQTNALMSEATKNAEVAKVQTEGQKIALGLYTAKGNGPWNYESRIVLQNQGGDENHVPLLVPHLGTNETLLVSGDFKLGVKVESIWNQPLKAQDYIVISGTYKQVVSCSISSFFLLEKLNARIEALELALAGRLTDIPANTLLGRNVGTGIVELLSQTQFAKPSDIDAAINTLVGNSSTALDTLTKLGAAIANDPNFATTILNLLADKVGKTGNETITGTKTFAGVVQILGSVPGFWLEETDGGLKGTYIVANDGKCSIQRRAANFGAFEANLLSVLLSSGDITISSLTDAVSLNVAALKIAGGVAAKNLFVADSVKFASLPTSPTGLTTGALYRTNNTINIV